MSRPNSKNIVLTGFMGTGKSAVGAELAKRLGRRLLDVDTEIERREGMKIPEIFALKGEPEFRMLETGMVKEVSAMKGLVISTGGGVVLNEVNMEALRCNGVIVCVTASPETILERTGKSMERPLLDVPDPMEKIREMLGQRAPYYENADITVDTGGKSPMEVAGEILDALRWK